MMVPSLGTTRYGDHMSLGYSMCRRAPPMSMICASYQITMYIVNGPTGGLSLLRLRPLQISSMANLKLSSSNEMAFSPDGKQLATMGRNLSFWDVPTRTKRFKINPLPYLSYGCFSPTGDRFAIKNTLGNIKVLDSASGYELCIFKNQRDVEGSNIFFSPCGSYLIDGSGDGDILVKNIELGIVEFKVSFPGEAISSIQHCPSSDTWIFRHSRPATDYHSPPPPDYFTEWRWPFRKGGFTILAPSELFIRAAAISPDGLMMAMTHGAPPSKLSIMRTEDGRELFNFAVKSGAHVEWCPRSIYVGCVVDKKVIIIDVRMWRIAAEFPMRYPCTVTFSPTEHKIALGSFRSGLLVEAQDYGLIPS